MAISRYRNVEILDEAFFATSDFPTQAELDEVAVIRVRISSFDRLDVLASKHLGDGNYWWVIALMNGIDWAYAIEPGQIIKIPVDVNDVLRLF